MLDFLKEIGMNVKMKIQIENTFNVIEVNELNLNACV